jgi:hypothetical protein
VSVARFNADQRTRYRVPHTAVCVLLGVSLAWFYKWAARGASPGAVNGLHTTRDRRRDTIGRAVGVAFKRHAVCTVHLVCTPTSARMGGRSRRRRWRTRCAAKA